MGRVNIAVVGLGNCASSLIQGIHKYRGSSPEAAVGLLRWAIGPYTPGDIHVVAAFDVDQRKVGRDAGRAIFEKPNCTQVFYPDVPELGVPVRMGRILDGVSDHMASFPAGRTFLPANLPEPDEAQVTKVLTETGAHVLVNYLPVGSEQAARFYARAALEAGVALVNCMPAFIVSDPAWADRFEEKGLPLVGDDIKSQLGATIVHRVLTDLFRTRGVRLDRSYQLNTGGNTDFLNMLNRDRLASKRVSKTEAVQSVAGDRLADENLHIGPSDYVAWQNDRKVCFLRMEGRLFGDVPMNIELRLDVEDSPNSGGVAIDAIRCAKLALDRGIGGPLIGPSALFMKHPPQQTTDHDAHQRTEAFIAGQPS